VKASKMAVVFGECGRECLSGLGNTALDGGGGGGRGRTEETSLSENETVIANLLGRCNVYNMYCPVSGAQFIVPDGGGGGGES
jgi:hypothetical protein